MGGLVFCVLWAVLYVGMGAWFHAVCVCASHTRSRSAPSICRFIQTDAAARLSARLEEEAGQNKGGYRAALCHALEAADPSIRCQAQWRPLPIPPPLSSFSSSSVDDAGGGEEGGEGVLVATYTNTRSRGDGKVRKIGLKEGGVVMDVSLCCCVLLLKDEGLINNVLWCLGWSVDGWMGEHG